MLRAMRTTPFETVDVFTTERFGGNPLAVFPDAAGLAEADLQRIAQEFNLSETSFVFPPQDPAHTAHVRIFTPVRELPFAGHPNVGTALVLAARGGGRPERMVFEEAAGLVTVRFDWPAPGSVGHPRAAVEAPVPLSLGAPIPVGLVAACTGLSAADIVTSAHAPLVAGMGAHFVIAEVTADALGRAAPDLVAIRGATGGPTGFSIHLHAHTPQGRQSRMFAPLSGIIEDPATGSANLVLSALLLSLGTAPRHSLPIRQGREMGRPSFLHTEAWRTPDGIRASVGGSAVPVLSGTLRL